ncbi:MAG: hypothetical protein AABZ06_11840 [Bdellovibrionota bacterium]
MLKTLTTWLLVSLALHSIAAIYSAGFYHADEHFQILEFMNYHLGNSPASDLPIEFHRSMRPWMQPAVYGFISSLLKTAGVTNTLTLALWFRIFSAFIGWLSVAGLVMCGRKWFKTEAIAIVFALIWYLPAFHARHSSENLAGSMFFIGVSLLVLFRRGILPKSVVFFAGFLLGLAFEFRYQVGIMVAGFYLWMFFFKRSQGTSTKDLYIISLGVCSAVVLGIFVDRWGYGHWTFAPWNYLQYNIIENHVSDVDTSPWYDYFRRAFTETWPPLGFLLLVSFVIAWIRHPRHVLTWSTLPLFLIHMIIGHKELRFLFPIIHAGPALLVMALYPWFGKLCEKLKLLRWLTMALVATNIAALLVTSLVPAWMPIRFYSYINSTPGINEIYYMTDNPFNVGGIRLNFYRPKNLELHSITDYSMLDPGGVLFFHTRSTLPPVLLDDIAAEKIKCSLVFQSLPTLVEHNIFKGILDRVTNWSLFNCQMG